jgi:hypothetical protein
MRATVLAAFSMALLTAPAVAQAQAGAEEPAKAEPKICRVDRATGSLAKRHKICKTRAEWDALRRQTKSDIEDIQRNSGAIPRTAGGMGSPAGSQ